MTKPPIDDYCYWLMQIEQKIKEVNKGCLHKEYDGLIDTLSATITDIQELTLWIYKQKK